MAGYSGRLIVALENQVSGFGCKRLEACSTADIPYLVTVQVRFACYALIFAGIRLNQGNVTDETRRQAPGSHDQFAGKLS